MSLSLKDFRTGISDFARPNRFEINIIPPSTLDYVYKQFNKLNWLAETAQIPSRTQGELKMKFHGMSYTIPGDFEKENLTIGFINSYGFEGRFFFDQWMENIQATNTDNSRKSSYDLLNNSALEVIQLGRTENDILAVYKFYDVFPTNISTIDLSMTEYDTIEKFTVGFSYSYFDEISNYKGNI